MKYILILIIVVSCAIGGCSSIQTKDGELVIGKDTTAGVEDLGIASISKQF